MENSKLIENTKPKAQDAFAALPGVAHVKRAMEVAVAGAHPITIIDCNGYDTEYRAAYRELHPEWATPAPLSEHEKPGHGKIEINILKPCPCGNLTNPERACVCSIATIRRFQNTAKYRKALKADIVVDAGYIRAWDFDTSRNEGADAVLRRIRAATKAESVLSEDAERLLNHAYSKLQLNANERDRAVRVATTIAGLDQSARVEARHITESVQYIGSRVDRM